MCAQGVQYFPHRTLDLAFKHLLEHYLELHSGVMIQDLRACMSASQQPGGPEPSQARPFCGAWADVLAGVKSEVAALQGRWTVGRVQSIDFMRMSQRPAMHKQYSTLLLAGESEHARAAAEGQRGGYDPVDTGLGLSGSMAQLTESPFAVSAVLPGRICPSTPLHTVYQLTLGRH